VDKVLLSPFEPKGCPVPSERLHRLEYSIRPASPASVAESAIMQGSREPFSLPEPGAASKRDPK
jgi:hypothetical protein